MQQHCQAAADAAFRGRGMSSLAMHTHIHICMCWPLSNPSAAASFISSPLHQSLL